MPLLPFLRARLPLVLLGLCCEFAYLGYFVRQFPLLQYYARDMDMGGITGHSHAGFTAFVGIFCALFLVVGFAWWLAHELGDVGTLWLVLGFGALFSVTLVFVYPITAIDIYSYIDQSRIMLHYHQNPIFTPPAQYAGDSLMALSDGWTGAGAPYGPLGLVIDALPMLVVGGNLLANLILLKLMFSAMTLVSAWLVYQILQRVQPAFAVSGALLVAWNPLVLFEVSVNGHNDVAMMTFALLGLLSVMDGELVVGPLLILASALVKYSTLVLIPLVVLYGIARQPTWEGRAKYALTVFFAMLTIAALAYARFWQGPETLTHLVYQTQRYLASFSTVLPQVFPGGISQDRAALLGRVLFLAVYLYALNLCTRGRAELVDACFLVMFAFVGLALTNFESWYGIWPIFLAAAVPGFADRLAAFLFSWGATLGAAFFGYIWVWWGLSGAGLNLVNELSYGLAFVPATAVIVALRVWRERTGVAHGREPGRMGSSET